MDMNQVKRQTNVPGRGEVSDKSATLRSLDFSAMAVLGGGDTENEISDV